MNTKYLILNFNFERAFSLRCIITFSFYDFLYLTKKVPKMKLGQIRPMQNLIFFLRYRNVQKKSFRFFADFMFFWFPISLVSAQMFTQVKFRLRQRTHTDWMQIFLSFQSQTNPISMSKYQEDKFLQIQVYTFKLICKDSFCSIIWVLFFGKKDFSVNLWMWKSNKMLN